jgi:hypothetical protein
MTVAGAPRCTTTGIHAPESDSEPPPETQHLPHHAFATTPRTRNALACCRDNARVLR